MSDQMEKVKRITNSIYEGIKDRGVVTMECLLKADIGVVAACACNAARLLRRPPFDCNFQYVVKTVNGREATGISITMRSKPERSEEPQRRRSNAIMELEL